MSTPRKHKGVMALVATAAMAAPLMSLGDVSIAAPSSASASLTIVEVATPGSNTNFRFGGTLGAFSLDDPATDDGDSVTSSTTFDIEPGTVRVRQQKFSRWDLDAIDCTPTRNPVVTKLDRGLAILDIQSGENITCTFRNSKAAATGTLSVRVGEDSNGNGRLNAGDPWLADWTVRLIDQDGYPVAEQTTDAEGRATFTAAPGDYSVCQVVQDGWRPTKPLIENGSEPCYDVPILRSRTSYVRFFSTQGWGDGAPEAISADGRSVVFYSSASNLVSGDTT